MNPCAIKGVEVVTDGEAGITLRHPTRGEVQLRGVAAAVWRQADGARSVRDRLFRRIKARFGLEGGPTV